MKKWTDKIRRFFGNRLSLLKRIKVPRLLLFIFLINVNYAFPQAMEMIWQQNFGGTALDQPRAIIEDADGGLLIAGYSDSEDNDVTANHGQYDFWLLKIDSFGEKIWERSFGGSEYDQCYDILSTQDGGFIMCGTSRSEDGDVTENYGNNDVWIVKINNAGEIEWQKNYGGENLTRLRK